jgi:hypothetical protein
MLIFPDRLGRASEGRRLRPIDACEHAEYWLTLGALRKFAQVDDATARKLALQLSALRIIPFTLDSLTEIATA